MQEHPNNAENGNFSKIRYESGSYKEVNLYIETQPLDSRKQGFGSRDANRRDEFSNSVRTEQYRETLLKELKVKEKNAPNYLAEIERLKQERASTAPLSMTRTRGHPLNETYNDFVPQYDIGRKRVTPFDPKAIKDTYYKFDTNYDKRMGSCRTSSSTIGECAWDLTYKPPSHGGRSEVKNFFDKSHLRV